MQKKRNVKKRESIIYKHIENNLKNYIIVTIMFLVGVIIRGIIY